MSRVSIKMIAQTLGVSNATVSLVLNGKEKEGRVGKELAEKIRIKAKELNYEPNSLARSLRMGKSQTIGLIVADISNPFFGKLAFHIQEQAQKYGYTVFITNTNEDTEKMQTMINTLKNRQVDGFIIIPTEYGSDAIRDLNKTNIPVVLLDRYYPDITNNYVIIDNFNSAYKAAEFILSQGCRKTAFITYQNSMQHFTQRLEGYTEAMKNAKMLDVNLIKKVRYSNLEKDIIKTIDKVLEKDIDSIFFATDSICAAAIEYLQKKDPSVLKKLRLTSFDYSEIFDFIDKPVSHILQPLPEMGKKSIDILMDLINSKLETQETQTVCFPCEFVLYK